MDKVCIIMKNKLSLFVFAAILSVSCTGGSMSRFAVERTAGIDGLHAPWDGLNDDTRFRCFADDGRFYFFYDVVDSTITISRDYKGERDVDFEDRVEIFFSAHNDMRRYYCAEIDPLARVMDYSAEFKARLDYSWNFKTLRAFGGLTETGYSVAGYVSLDELKQFGIDFNDFYMGIFRADFHSDGSVNWFSHVETDDESPYFHKPDMLFNAKIK